MILIAVLSCTAGFVIGFAYDKMRRRVRELEQRVAEDGEKMRLLAKACGFYWRDGLYPPGWERYFRK